MKKYKLRVSYEVVNARGGKVVKSYHSECPLDIVNLVNEAGVAFVWGVELINLFKEVKDEKG